MQVALFKNGIQIQKVRQGYRHKTGMWGHVQTGWIRQDKRIKKQKTRNKINNQDIRWDASLGNVRWILCKELQACVNLYRSGYDEVHVCVISMMATENVTGPSAFWGLYSVILLLVTHVLVQRLLITQQNLEQQIIVLWNCGVNLWSVRPVYM